MARFDTSFDATSVEPTTAYELLPAGKYRAQIVESEMRVILRVSGVINPSTRIGSTGPAPRFGT
jgi:hypothetical protein